MCAGGFVNGVLLGIGHDLADICLGQQNTVLCMVIMGLRQKMEWGHPSQFGDSEFLPRGCFEPATPLLHVILLELMAFRAFQTGTLCLYSGYRKY